MPLNPRAPASDDVRSAAETADCSAGSDRNEGARTEPRTLLRSADTANSELHLFASSKSCRVELGNVAKTALERPAATGRLARPTPSLLLGASFESPGPSLVFVTVPCKHRPRTWSHTVGSYSEASDPRGVLGERTLPRGRHCQRQPGSAATSPIFRPQAAVTFRTASASSTDGCRVGRLEQPARAVGVFAKWRLPERASRPHSTMMRRRTGR